MYTGWCTNLKKKKIGTAPPVPGRGTLSKMEFPFVREQNIEPQAQPEKSQAIMNVRNPTTTKEVQQLTWGIATLPHFLPCTAITLFSFLPHWKNGKFWMDGRVRRPGSLPHHHILEHIVTFRCDWLRLALLPLLMPFL